MISLPYFILRFATSGGLLAAGLLQTFVFAHVLTPKEFSIYILSAALGVSMWLFDLGMTKILFVRLRADHLAGADTSAVAAQANAVAILYAILVIAGSLIHFGVLATRPSISIWQAAEFALFFLFAALNLVWFVLRNLSVAVDKYIYFESLEAVRRVGHMLALIAMLVGLPLPIFLLAVNLLWIVLFVLAVIPLVRLGALRLGLRGVSGQIFVFFSENRAAALFTSMQAVSELYLHNILYLVVPIVFGLGAPIIILDTTLKVFFGVLTVCAAACDLLLPRQTSAFAKGDRPALLRATLAAAGLCSIPVLLIGAVLMFAADPLFALLLGPAAHMPAALAPIFPVLLAAGVLKTVSSFLLTHTGYFKECARLSVFIGLLMTVVMSAAALMHFDIIGFLRLYAASFALGAIFYAWQAVRGPIGAAPEKLSRYPT
jgi:O-antigen/teichoic acid export membrane protein